MHFSYGNVCLKLCECAIHSPQTLSSSRFCLMTQNLLDKPVCYAQILFPNLCKQNCLYGNLPFFKIHVNHFTARDNSPGAKVISKMHVVGEGSGAIL